MTLPLLHRGSQIEVVGPNGFNCNGPAEEEVGTQWVAVLEKTNDTFGTLECAQTVMHVSADGYRGKLFSPGEVTEVSKPDFLSLMSGSAIPYPKLICDLKGEFNSQEIVSRTIIGTSDDMFIAELDETVDTDLGQLTLKVLVRKGDTFEGGKWIDTIWSNFTNFLCTGRILNRDCSICSIRSLLRPYH